MAPAHTTRSFSHLWLGLLALLAFGIVGGVDAQNQVSRNTASAESQDASALSTASKSEIHHSSPNDPVLLKADTLIQNGKLLDAEKNIRAYLATNAASAEGHFLLGYVLYREQKPTGSLAEYTQGAQYRRPDANDLATVAMDYILLHAYSDADKWLSRAVSWEPENALYWYYLGRTKYTENRFQEAVDAFKKSLNLRPRDVRSEYNLGLAYVGLGRTDEAIAAYQTAIAWQATVAKQDPQPYLDLGMLLTQQGHADQAILNLRKAVELNPRNPKAHEELGRAYERLHNLPDAKVEFQDAIALAPNVSALHFELGRIYQKEGLHAQAQNEFIRCTALNATHSTDSTETPNPDLRR